MSAAKKDVRGDLQADLLADLAVTEPPAPPVAVPPAPLPPPATRVTPVVSMQCTPLRWSRPKVVRAAGGAGKALRLGPLQVELSVKE